MHAPGKLVERTQPLLSEAPRVLCYPSSAAPKSPSASPGCPRIVYRAGFISTATGGSARDNETYDDGEFYQQLLKEFLEGSVSGAFAVVAASRVCIGSTCLRGAQCLCHVRGSHIMLKMGCNAMFSVNAMTKLKHYDALLMLFITGQQQSQGHM